MPQLHIVWEPEGWFLKGAGFSPYVRSPLLKFELQLAKDDSVERSANTTPHVLILGGGPAGAAAAIDLARRGRTVTLLEQSTGPHHKVCGEFFSHEAIAYLDRLGIDPRALGAVSIHGVRLAARGPIASCDLPFPALSLTRRTLDEALLALAAQCGANILRGRRVDALRRTANGFAAYTSNGETHTASTAFLATGKHDLAGFRRGPGRQNNLVAFKMYFRLAAAQRRALEGWVELFVFPGGYAGLELAEDEQANLCLLVTRDRLADCDKSWPALLAHLVRSSDLLAQRLEGAEALLAKPLALSSIPYGLLVARGDLGLWRMGDQAAVIPSFSGDGISIALHSAHLAANLFTRGATSVEFAQRLAAELRPSIARATAISRLLVAAPVLAQAARLWPPLLSVLAARTRISQSALPPPSEALGAPS
jgi:flavin-dependent dehydrogenase